MKKAIVLAALLISSCDVVIPDTMEKVRRAQYDQNMSACYKANPAELYKCTGGTEIILLAKEDGNKVQCGPYALGQTAASSEVAMQSLRGCVSDFQRQGFNRVAASK